MPIRLCQKCGLKVLIDESQSATNPFYCQRCTTAMKGGAEREDIAAYAAGPAAPPVRASGRATPLPTAALAAPSPVASGARPATIKVLCPYCKASFNGRVPQKPARGSCPVCQKELILLPDGDIRPSAGFDLNSWQSEKSAPQAAEASAPQEESGTQVLMRKYAAAPPPPPPEPAPEPSPNADTDVPDESAALPSWLDDSSSAKKAPAKAAPQPVPETDIEIDIVQPSSPAEESEPVRLEDLPPPPPPAPRARPAARPAAAASSQSTAARPAVAAPIAAPQPESASGLRKPVPSRGTERTRGSAPAPAANAPAATGAGLYLLALLLVLIPVGSAGGLLGAREKLTSQEFVAKLGGRFSKGLKALHLKLFPPEAPAPKPEEPKPAEVKPEVPAQPTAEDQKLDEEAINKAWMEFKREDRTFRQKSVGATAAEKAEYKSVEDELKKKQARIEELKARYQKLYGKSYDPRDQ